MSESSIKSRRDVIGDAARWHARISAEDATSRDWQDLEAWLAKDPQHREIFAAMASMQGTLQALGEDSRLKALHEEANAAVPYGDAGVGEQSRAPRIWAWGRAGQMALAASVLVALIVPLLYFMADEEAAESRYYETAIGERKSIELDDGSSITLNADSRVAVTMTDKERTVELQSGEAFFDVAAEPGRPFNVSVGDNLVTVLGTSFDVRYRDTPARVTVVEGRVQVALKEDGPGTSVELQAGQQFVLQPGSVPAELSLEELANLADWRNGWLHFENSRFAEVVKDLEPYVDKRLVLTSRRVADLEVGGSFQVDNIDSVLTALESLLPIRVSYESDRIVIRHESDPMPAQN